MALDDPTVPGSFRELTCLMVCAVVACFEKSGFIFISYIKVRHLCIRLVARASLVRCCKLDDVNKRRLFLVIVKVGSLRPGVQQAVTFGDGPLSSL